MCLTKQTIKVQLSGIGILQIAPGCRLKTSGVTLSSISSPSQTSVVIYEPRLHLNLSELSPALLQNQKLMCMPKTTVQVATDVAAKEDDYRETDETLAQLENQLNEISFQRRTRTKQMILTHGSYLGSGFLSMGLLVFLCRAEILAGATIFLHCLQRKGKKRSREIREHRKKQRISLEVSINKNDARKVQQDKKTPLTSVATSEANMPAPKTRAARPTLSAAVQLPPQNLQPM